MKSYLDMITAIGTIVQIITVLISLYFVVLQLRQTNKIRQIELLREIIDEIGNEEIRDIRNMLSSEECEVGIDKIRKIAVAYDRISFMLMCDLDMAKKFYQFQGREVIKLWKKVEENIVEYRAKKDNPDYCIHFQKLYDYYLKIQS